MLNRTLNTELAADNYSDEIYCTYTPSQDIQQEIVQKPAVIAKELHSLFAYDKEIHYRLVYYALKNIRLYFASDTANCFTAHDVVQIVLEKVLTGARKWNKELVPDLKAFLFLSIISFIRNEKIRIKDTGHLDIDLHSYENSGAGSNNYFAEPAYEICDDDIFITDMKAVIIKLRESLKDDVYASFILEEILEGADSNIEIAGALGISVKDVENAKRRIRKKSLRLLKNSG